MHSLPGMILLYLAEPFLHQRCSCMRYHHFYNHIGPEFLTQKLHIATLTESWSEDTLVSALAVDYITHTEFLIESKNVANLYIQIYLYIAFRA